MLTLGSLLRSKPMLIKNGQELEINIISSDPFSGEQAVKNVIKQTVGDNNISEHIGKGDEKIRLKIYCELQQDYIDLVNFVSDGSSFILACNFFSSLVPVRLEGGISHETYYEGWCVATLSLTTALDPYSDLNLISYANNLLGSKLGATASSKKDFLDKLRNFGKNTTDFVSNTNQKIGAVTNTVAVYSAAITNIANGVASSSSIITNPISSVKSSLSQVIGGVSGIVSAMANAINAIKQIPDDVDQLVDTFLQIGDQLNGLFNSENSNEDLKQSCEFLQTVADSIINADLSADNPSVYSGDSVSAEFFLSEIKDRNNETISVLILASILINLYENAENIDKWNSISLEKLRSSTEAIYTYINSFKIDSEVSFQLDLARVRFFQIFQNLYKTSLKVITVKITEPSHLLDIIYSVNGNLDYYDETKQLNNIVGTTVYKDIQVISND